MVVESGCGGWDDEGPSPVDERPGGFQLQSLHIVRSPVLFCSRKSNGPLLHV